MFCEIVLHSLKLFTGRIEYFLYYGFSFSSIIKNDLDYFVLLLRMLDSILIQLNKLITAICSPYDKDYNNRKYHYIIRNHLKRREILHLLKVVISLKYPFLKEPYSVERRFLFAFICVGVLNWRHRQIRHEVYDDDYDSEWLI